MAFGKPPNVMKLEKWKNRKGLIKALDYKKNWGVRSNAAQSLGKIGNKKSVAPLIAVLNDDEWAVVKSAADALGKLCDDRAVSPLIAALNCDDSRIIKSVANALGIIGDPRAEGPLISALKNKDQQVQEVVAKSLDNLGWQPDQSESGAYYWIAKWKWEKCVQIGAPALEPLITALKDENYMKRENAIMALGKIGDARAVKPLIKMLDDDFNGVVYEASIALGLIGIPAVEPLIKALTHKRWEIRKVAADTLGKIDDIRSIEALSIALGDENSDVRRSVVLALSKKRSLKAVKPLTLALKDKDWRVCKAAIGGLGNIGDPQAMKALMKLLMNKTWDIRNSAAKTLKNLNWQPDQDATGAAYWIALDEWDKCAEIGLPAVGPLIKYSKKKHMGLVKNAARVLAMIDSPKAKEALVIAEQKILQFEEEFDEIVKDLVNIGPDGYLSQGGTKNKRTCEIGIKLNKLGGKELMLSAYSVIRKRYGKIPARELEVCWGYIGTWLP